MPALDGLRAVACLLVVLIHANSIFQLSLPPNLGGTGVSLFFCLSGFLMGMLYVRQSWSTGHAKEYIASRFSRITPAYYAAILFCWGIFVAYPDFEYVMTPATVARCFAFICSAGVLWSIPPEVQFYILFLALWWLHASYREGRHKALLLGLYAAIFVLILTRSYWPGILLPAKLHVFMYGFLAALFLKPENFKCASSLAGPRGLMVAQILCVIAAIGYFALFLDHSNFFNDLIYPALLTLCVVSFTQTSPLTPVLTNGIMRLIGAASFSIYLFHLPLLFLLEKHGPFSGHVWTIAATILSVVLPIAFHLLAEKRMNAYVKKQLLKL